MSNLANLARLRTGTSSSLVLRATSAALDLLSHAPDPTMANAIFDDLTRRLRQQNRLD